MPSIAFSRRLFRKPILRRFGCPDVVWVGWSVLQVASRFWANLDEHSPRGLFLDAALLNEIGTLTLPKRIASSTRIQSEHITRRRCQIW
jgi:hypothetical protein